MSLKNKLPGLVGDVQELPDPKIPKNRSLTEGG